MEKKINIAELLKNCPKGMELDCTMLDNVVFEKIDTSSPFHPIIIRRTDTNKTIHLTKYGQYSIDEDYKCVIFPKGKTTWDGFVPPCQFKDGDVLAEDSCIFIIQKIGDNFPKAKTHCTLYDDGCFDDGSILYFDLDSTRLATEEEKQKLFDAIKENGYKWNAENKTLEKFVEPKFKVNDKIKLKGGDEFGIITQVSDCFYTIKCKNNTHYWSIKKQDNWELINEPKFKVGDVIVHIYRKHLNGDSRSSKIYQITNDKYIFTDGSFIYIQDQNKWELVTNKFDITTLKPFESRVLVRNSNGGFWQPTFWGIYEEEKANEHHYRNYLTTKGFFRHCIPYNDDTKHLLGTTDDCDDYFKTWE
jgi:hypothetical protein